MIKKLMVFAGEYKRFAILTPILVSLEVVAEVIIPVLMARLIDFGIDGGSMTYIIKIGITLLMVSAAALTFGALAGKTAAIGSAGFAKNLRQAIYYNVQNFSFSNIDKFSVAGIVTRLTSDVSNVQQSFQMITRMAIRAPIMMLFSLVVSFGIDAKLSLIFVGCMPFLALGLFFIIKNAHPIFMKVFKTYDKLNGVVEENLRGIRVVKSFNREAFEDEKFGNISSSIYSDFCKTEKILAFNMPLMQFSMYTCMILVSWFGARSIVACKGNPALGLSTGELMSLITYASQILSSLMVVSMIFVSLTMSRASGARIVEILEEESDIKNPENPITEIKNGNIAFHDVSFSYLGKSEKSVLQHINLSIKSGETIGILGGTGSSKTSLVQLIPRLYDANQGSVTVGDTDVKNYDIEALRNSIGMVLQKNTLFSGTIKENLKWGNENATDEDMISACRIARADEFIKMLPNGYDTYIEQGGSNVSGGQKQRICIARALLKNPKILILDDSTSAVDTKTDSEIRWGLKNSIPNTTKIIIAQRISSVRDSDKIIVMDDGKINAVGTHDELLKTCSIYKEVFDFECEGRITQ